MAISKMQTAGDNLRDPGAGADTSTSRDDYLQLARDAFRSSEDYFDANIRKDIERNLSHFGNRHAPGSKYYSGAYKYRAKGFRPKTRAIIRKNEAAAATALFSTTDVVHISAEQGTDEAQRVSAEINQQLLQYRLTNTVPWFLTAVGAYQETLVSGVVISHQFWDYQEETRLSPEMDEQDQPILDEEGQPALREEYDIVSDTPMVELRPIENVRFSPAADWRDPMTTSPYIIDMIPMTIDEIKERSKPTKKNPNPWFELNEEQLSVGSSADLDPVRQQREGGREDSKDQRHNHLGFDIAWVHRNIFRQDGQDIVFYTLGVHHRLSDPVPLRTEYPHLKPGARPYVLGVSNIEAHKNYPESLTGLAANLQQEANDIGNQRRDNVALVLNRRYIAKRGAATDYKSLMRNVPGSITLTDDIRNDLRIEAPPEVTGSSYQEQDRVNMDYDELTGAFSTSSVGSNRQLNETVGGMNLLNQGANQITEYQLRIFVETWVEPVLKQMIQLEQRHETDEALLAMMGEKVQMWERYNVNQVTDRMIQGSMNVQINVGFGATNPQQRIEKLVTGVSTVMQLSPAMVQRLDGEEVASEIFGALGYKGIDRFFPAEPDPNKPQPEPQPDPRMQLEQMKAEAAMQLAQMKAGQEQQRMELETQVSQIDAQERAVSEQEERQLKFALAQMKLQGDMMELAQKKEMSLEQIKAELGSLAIKERGSNSRFLAEKNFAIQHGGGRGL